MKTNKFLYIDKIIALEKQLDFSDDRQIILEELAKLYYKAGEYQKSVECFRKIDSDDNRLTFANYEMFAAALTRIGDIDGAERVIKKNRQFISESPDYLCDLALVESFRGNSQKSSEYIFQAVELFGNHPSVLITKAESAYLLGRTDEGKQIFLDLFNYVSGEEINRLVIIVARFCLSVNCPEDARFFLNRSEYVRNHRFYFELATVAISLKLYTKALVYLEHYLGEEPENAYAIFLKGLCITNLGNRSDEAVESFQKAISLVPYNYVFNYFLSLEYIIMQKYDLACRILNNIYSEELFRRDEDYAYALGMSSFLAGDHQKALDFFRIATTVFTHNNEIMKGYLKMLSIMGENPPDAVSLYDTLISHSDGRTDLLDVNFSAVIGHVEKAGSQDINEMTYEHIMTSARKHLNEKKLLASMKLFFQARKLRPAEIAPPYYIAKISYTLNELDMAYQNIEKAFRMDGDNFYILYLYYKIMHMKLLPIPKFIWSKLIETGEKEGIEAIKCSDWKEAYELYTRLFDISRNPKYFYYYLEALNQLGKKAELQKEIDRNIDSIDFSEFPQIKQTIMEFKRIEST